MHAVLLNCYFLIIGITCACADNNDEKFCKDKLTMFLPLKIRAEALHRQIYCYLFMMLLGTGGFVLARITFVRIKEFQNSLDHQERSPTTTCCHVLSYALLTCFLKSLGANKCLLVQGMYEKRIYYPNTYTYRDTKVKAWWAQYACIMLAMIYRLAQVIMNFTTFASKFIYVIYFTGVIISVTFNYVMNSAIRL